MAIQPFEWLQGLPISPEYLVLVLALAVVVPMIQRGEYRTAARMGVMFLLAVVMYVEFIHSLVVIAPTPFAIYVFVGYFGAIGYQTIRMVETISSWKLPRKTTVKVILACYPIGGFILALLFV